ncbi:palmitoyltransferase akr1 [Serendipita sp. 400]|nr:palmitoyltransferase akr1 [Serendipita sp. 400]
MASGIGNIPTKGASTAVVSTEGDMQAEFSGHGQQTVQEPEDTIFSASQRGDLELVKRLVESGEATVNDRDPQNISPLHWAAINANLPICRYLLEQGAEVDVVGGELAATPLQWAARNGHLYVLHLLLSHNADPTLKDSQGYDSLQLTTHSSSVMSLLYMLQQPVSINSRDLQGHTPLMWAAYQGDAISVDILLKHNADPLLQDEKGMSALHWGVVKANKSVIRRLIEASPALLQTRDESGKTPRELSQSLKSFSPFKRALEEGGMDEMGLPLKRPVLSERNTRLAILILPTLCLGAIFKTFEILPWWTALPLAAAEFLGMHHVISRVLLAGRLNDGGVTNSPYCAGIIIGTMVWLGWCWFTRIVYNTPGYVTANLAFCVGKHDHHCPWVWNCVGVGNHRQFLVFVITLVMGVLVFDYLAVAYFKLNTPISAYPPDTSSSTLSKIRSGLDSITPSIPSSSSSTVVPSDSCILPSDFCAATTFDSFLTSLLMWANLQVPWTFLLLCTQVWQVCRQMTTYEVSNLGRYGWMGGRGTSLQGQMGAIGAHAAGQPDGLPTAHGHRHAHGAAGHSHGQGRAGFLMKLMGLDRFTQSRDREGLLKLGKKGTGARNPFDLGCMGNCRDFWTNGREVGVDYQRLYEVPSEGFQESKRRRRERLEEEGLLGDEGSSGRKGFMRRMSIGGWGSLLGGRTSGREGYTPVRMDENV